MFKALFYKWFGLVDIPCDTCEVLRHQLDESNRERRELLNRLLDKDKPEPVEKEKEELKPLGPQFVPWRVRQQMLEAQDREQARLLREKKLEMAQQSTEELEKELEIE